MDTFSPLPAASAGSSRKWVRMGIVIGKSGRIVAENWNRKTFTDIYNFRLLGKHTITKDGTF
jgi:hypothetical protein